MIKNLFLQIGGCSKLTLRLIFLGLSFVGTIYLLFYLNVVFVFSFDPMNYIISILFRFLVYIWVWVFYFSVFFFQMWLFSLIFFFKFIFIGVDSFFALIFGSTYILGCFCMSIMQGFIDFLRILVSITVQPFAYYEVFKSTGIRFSSLFSFRPVVVIHLHDPGTSFQLPLIAEVLFLQVLVVLLQIIWGATLIVYSMIIFNFSFFYTIPVLIFVPMKLWVYSFFLRSDMSYSNISLCIFALYLFVLCLIFSKTKLLNFFNFQKIFSFVFANRWFGLNLSPGLSFSDLVIGVVKSRVRFVESSIWRLESFILFSSHLRLDPKMTEVIYWW